MSTELAKQKKGDLVATIEQQGLSELLKPLVREIHLFDSFVAGTALLPVPAVLNELKVADKLQLIREDNKFDSNAIMLLREDGKKVGYVPEKDNIVFARLLDAGKRLAAKITKIEQKGTFCQISIGIYLVDF